MAGLGQNAHHLWLVHLGFCVTYFILLVPLIWGIVRLLQWNSAAGTGDSDDEKAPVIAVIILCVVFIAIVVPFHLDKVASLRNEPKPAQPPVPALLPAELSLGCSPIDLPLTLHPDSTIEILLLNPLHTHPQEKHVQGFYTLGNTGSVDYSWPPTQLKKDKSANLPIQAYRCKMQNSGSSNLAEIVMTVKIYYGDNHGDDFDLHNFEVNPLPAGGHHVFYVVNQCSMRANVILGNSAAVHVVGETTRRRIPVSSPGANPIENILYFFPSNYNFGPCSIEEGQQLIEKAKRHMK